MIRNFISALAAAAMAFAPAAVMAQNTTPPASADTVLISRVPSPGTSPFAGDSVRGAVSLGTLFNSAGVGYSTGAGTAVTQGTSRTTGVTANTLAGQITMFSAAGSATAASFTVTDSKVGANDLVEVVEKSGTNLYELFVTNIAAGSFQVTFLTTGGTATDAPVISFVVIKGAAS